MVSIQKDQTPWLKRVLIPFWIIRILFMVLFAGLFAIAIAAIGVASSEDDNQLDKKAWHLGIGIAVFFLILLLLCLILDIVAIIKFARHNLSPRSMVIMNTIQTAIWTFLVVLEIVSVANGAAGSALVLPIIIWYVVFPPVSQTFLTPPPSP
jgi:hypothetical protein